MRNAPPLNALRAFEAAARHLSFKRAADELCITHGAVSRHIMKLEEHVGTKLFARHNRRVELTAEGARYNLQIRDAFRRIHEATAEMVASANRKSLKLKVPPTFAIRWLVPRLARFQARWPDVAVHISTPYDPNVERDFDMAVYYGAPNFPDGIACERLFAEFLMPVLSPALARISPPLRTPRDLERCVLLHSMVRMNDWRQWLRATGADHVDPESGLRFENSGLVYQGVAEGLGVAIAQFAFVTDDIATGRLVAPFPEYVKNEIGYYLVYPRERLRRPNAESFRAWILEEAHKTNRGSPRELQPAATP